MPSHKAVSADPKAVIQAQIDTLNSQVERLQGRISGLKDVLKLFSDPVTAKGKSKKGPKGKGQKSIKTQILDFLDSKSPAGVVPAEIKAALDGVNKSSVDTYLGRMKKDKEIVAKNGKYYAKKHEGNKPSTEVKEKALELA